MSEPTSFVDFYNENSIIPVRQSNTDSLSFLQKRLYLLSALGIPRYMLKSLRICEFGPGTGQNAQALIELGARDLTLVDASVQALSHLSELSNRYKQNMERLDIINSQFLDYKSDQLFHLVIAEGCIPHQSDPRLIAKVLSSHLAQDGILMISTISGLSHLPETLRRLYSSLLIGRSHPNIQDLDILVNFFEPDLNSLNARSRSTTDWCLDVIVQPLHKSALFSQADAINLFYDDFEVYHSLPSLISPFFWYKRYAKESHNSLCLDSYHKTNMCLISSEAPPLIHSIEDGIAAENLGNELWSQVSNYQHGEGDLNEILATLRQLSSLYRPLYPFVADYLDLSCTFVSNFDLARSSAEYSQGRKFWGRGQQYLSLIRR